MFSFEIDSSQLLKLFPELKIKIQSAVINLSNAVVSDLKRSVAVGTTHQLQSSITAIYTSDYTESYIGAFGVKYALPYFFGSRPHFPPVEPLIDWVRLRGFASDIPRAGTPEGLFRRAFILAKVISRKGTKSREEILDNIVEKYKNKIGDYFKL